MAEREVLDAIFHNSANITAAHVKTQLAYRHMIALADTFDGWAQDRRNTPERSAQILGWAEALRRLAEELGPTWNPETPATVSLVGFLGRMVLDEPSPPPTPQLNDPKVPLRQDSALASPLEMFRGWTLAIACPECVETRQLTVEQLIGCTEPAQSVASVIGRLRCQKCGATPCWVQLQDSPLSSAPRKIRLA